MTVRKNAPLTATPEAVAERLREPAVRLFPDAPALDPVTGRAVPRAAESYSSYFEELAAEVGAEAPHASRSFTLRVAELLGVSLADWLRRVMR